VKAGIGTWVSQKLSGDRAGPDTLNDVSMSAVDRRFEQPDYLDTKSLSNVRADLEAMDESRRENMRSAHRYINDGDTHLPGQTTRPGIARTPR